MKAVIFDTETTGLIDNRLTKLDKQPEIIEFYALEADLATGKVLSTLSHLIKPKKKIPKEIFDITGINDDLVKDCLPFEARHKEIQAFLIKQPFIIAHNLSYDIDMTELEFERLGLKVLWPKTRICTVEMTEYLRGYRMSLMNLYDELFGKMFEGAHRAEKDVIALFECCVELHKRGVI